MIREIEEAAIEGASADEIADAITRDYQARIAKAAEGLPFPAEVGLAAIGFVVGEVSGLHAPVLGPLVTTAGGVVAGRVLRRALQPRWLSVHRRVNGGANGI